jgi:hypothetical protein
MVILTAVPVAMASRTAPRTAATHTANRRKTLTRNKELNKHKTHTRKHKAAAIHNRTSKDPTGSNNRTPLETKDRVLAMPSREARTAAMSR